MEPEVFLDTAYAIALSSSSDNAHVDAVRLADEMEAGQTRVITTRAILMEIGNSLSKRRFRSAARELLQSLHDDPSVEIVPLSEQLYEKGFRLFVARPDKDWGLIDCVSFVVMQERGIVEALTTDEHYRQAGLKATHGLSPQRPQVLANSLFASVRVRFTGL